MEADEYNAILEIEIGHFDEDERKQLVADVNDEFGVQFTKEGEATELSDPAFTYEIFSTVVASASLLIQLYNTLNDRNQDQAVRINTGGDVHFIDAENVYLLNDSPILEEDGTAIVKLSTDELIEYGRKLRSEDNIQKDDSDC